jgi:hypothetical protein
MATSTDCAADFLAPTNGDLESNPDVLFERVASDFAAPLARLVRAQEADPALQQALMQEVHLALRRSQAWLDEGCPFHLWLTLAACQILDGTFAMNLDWAKKEEECADLTIYQSAHEPQGEFHLSSDSGRTGFLSQDRWRAVIRRKNIMNIKL